MGIFNKNKISKSELFEVIDALEEQVYNLKKEKAKLKHGIEMKFLKREQELDRAWKELDNDIRMFEDNKDNFKKAFQTENDILKEELEYIKRYKVLRQEAKMISEKDLVFDTLDKVKDLTCRE